MSKTIIYDSDAKTKLLAGIEKLEKAVSATLGPCGRNVIIDEYGTIHSTRDGVTVAKSIALKDKFENLGAQAVKEVAEKSADKVGDGTTTSTVLAASIYKNGLKHIVLGSNATQVKNGIKKAADKAVEYIKSVAKPISGKDGIKRVAVVSANGDERIGELISDVMSKIGNDGTVKVENGNGIDMTSKVVEGMVIDQSYESPYMVTNPDTMEAELDNPWVLIVDRKISNVKEILSTLQAVSQTGRPLFVIAESYADEVLATLIMNKMRGGLNSVVIKAPSYGENRRAILDDIAILCGGRVVTEATGTRLDNALPESGILGSAQRILVNKSNTIIIGGAGAKDAVTARADSIRAQIENVEEYEKDKLRERLAKLTSGIGVITVGAATETERKELRDRVDDAFCASKAAVRSGIVPGGGIALLNAKKAVRKWIDDKNVIGNESLGASIFCDALDAPIRKIISNSGLNTDQILMLIDMNGNGNADYGFNVLSHEYVNMIDDGIIDPAEVVINEIQNSASVAGLLLTTEALVVDEPEDKKPDMPQM